MYTEKDWFWLAGLLEGEGSFMAGPPSAPNSPIVIVAMTDGDVVARAAAMFGVGVRKYPPRKAHWKGTFSTVATGSRAMRLMEKLRPMMGSRRTRQINRAMACYRDKSTPRPLSTKQVRRIRELAAIGLSCRQIKKRGFPVSHVSIFKVMRGKSYRDVK